MKVYVEDQDQSTVDMFNGKYGYTVVNDRKEAELFCFTGGSDVSPELYGELNTSSHVDMQRDLNCVNLYLYALRNKIPCVGICRGGQFLNVMNGGKMIQHYHGHNKMHMMMVISRATPIEVTSTHHQVMVPKNYNNVLCFTVGDTKAVEVVYYQETNNLCYQPHPEWVKSRHECQEYFFDLIEWMMEGK